MHETASSSQLAPNRFLHAFCVTQMSFSDNRRWEIKKV
jgi:hypothetical protein